ncbi:hypothetical protein GCM10010909_30970 [Acidocella aquatica]|uniref:HTH tetR-type domain-containing protein n=1 Tax=Acidocella aquatica TaxID=1922313 RepID=A0ABQ6AC87_9PROT|nr:TetR/AcrR family transcriptional regulator [Acidocella aquatica]GLR68416.1 hypothetical protein GCM10010909_30970 [Acidocella aquatica]
MADKKTQSLQRVLECAMRLLAEKAFEAVSIMEVAEQAHCSTATIYDVYGSKENLFIAAVTHALQTMEIPRLPAQGLNNPLEKLLAYVEARTRWFARPEQRKVSRSMVSPFARMRKIVAARMQDERAYMQDMLTHIVKMTVDVGLLRDVGDDVIVYNIMAGTIYEPLLFGLIFGEETVVRFEDVVRKVFTPLVTEAGKVELDKFLGKMCKR